VSEARTPNAGMIQNLNPDFIVVRLQTIMESIQRMGLKGSPLVALAQKGAKATNLIVAEKSADNPRREPSVDNPSNDRARRAQSEATSSANGNRRLADNDARWQITQNRHLRGLVMTVMTSVMSLKIGSILEQGRRPLHVDL
jgi:hypothetical protein